MQKPVIKLTAVAYLLLIALWLAAFKSADIFGFFKNYSSLWFLPAGVTIAIILAVPKRLMLAPLIANLMLAIPQLCAVLDIEFTNSREPILHGIRLYLIYGGLGLLLRYGIKIKLPVGTLFDSHWTLGLTAIAAGIATISGIALHVAVGNFSWDVGWGIIRPWGVGDAIGAVIVPPLLVPLLLRLFAETPKPVEWHWPKPLSLAMQIAAIAAAMAIGFLAPIQFPELSGLWYVILLPPVFFALREGMPSAATSVFLTTMLAPPAAHFLGYGGEQFSLQLLLLISSVVGLTIGAAISDRKRAYDALKQSEHSLELQVAERTMQLEEANDFQKHLIRTLGHDLRHPMHSLNMILDGLSRELKGKSQAKHLEQAQSLGRSASEFITSVLDFARRDAGDVEVHMKEIPLQKVFDLLSAIFVSTADAKGIQLKIRDTNLMILSDEILLNEVLSNLIDNSIRLSVKGQRICLRAVQVQQFIQIEVIDQIETGEGCHQKQTGFGLEIINQICVLLGAKFEREPNIATITLKRIVSENLIK